MKLWEKDKRWSDCFLPEIKQILGEHLIGEPPVEEDTQRNTDLIVLKMDAVRIGCRIRRHKFRGRYGQQFTIRCSRPTGRKTELQKVIEGWGDYFFYGFGDTAEVTLSQWALLSLTHFRLWLMRQLIWREGQMPGERIPNKDGSSEFFAFVLRDLRDFGGVVAEKGTDANPNCRCR